MLRPRAGFRDTFEYCIRLVQYWADKLAPNFKFCKRWCALSDYRKLLLISYGLIQLCKGFKGTYIWGSYMYIRTKNKAFQNN